MEVPEVPRKLCQDFTSCGINLQWLTQPLWLTDYKPCSVKRVLWHNHCCLPACFYKGELWHKNSRRRVCLKINKICSDLLAFTGSVRALNSAESTTSNSIGEKLPLFFFSVRGTFSLGPHPPFSYCCCNNENMEHHWGNRIAGHHVT